MRSESRGVGSVGTTRPRTRAGLRTLAITQNITIDGAIEMLDTWFDPETHASEEMSDVLEEIRRQDADADALLLGRQTFEDFRSYWPEQTDDTSGITAYLNQVEKYVVSSTLTEPHGRTPRCSPATPRGGPRTQGATGQGHRPDRQHHPDPRHDRGRARRRVPPVHLPRSAGARPPAVPRRLPPRGAATGALVPVRGDLSTYAVIGRRSSGAAVQRDQRGHAPARTAC